MDEVISVKRECAHTRKFLRKYLQGHLFKLEQIRIERHLKSCAVCSSEYQALKHADETRKILRDITPPQGMVQRVREGVSGLARLKKLVYRPLWIAAIIGVLTLVYINVIAPQRRDLEIENLERSLPSRAPIASAPTITPAPSGAQPVVVPPSETAAAIATPAAGPLEITITLVNEKEGIRHINEIIKGHNLLGKTRFNDSLQEISGSLTAQELFTLFESIGSGGRATYSRKQFKSFPNGKPIPFVMKLKPPPDVAVRPSSPAPIANKPAPVTVGAEPGSTPTPTATEP